MRKKKETAIVPAGLEAALAPKRAEAEEVMKMVQRLDLSTQGYRDKAGTVLAEIRTIRTDLEKERTGITGPILEGKRRVDQLYKPVSEYWQACDEALTARLLEATQAADQAQVRALAAVAATRGDTDSATLVAAHTAAGTPAGLDLRKSWSYRITDIDQVPDEYWCLDAEKLRRVVIAARGQIEIPGVAVEQEQTFARSRAS